MKRIMKKLTALLLAMVMVLAMSVTAFAETPTGSLKVTVNEGNTLEGQTLDVYKLFDLTVNGEKYAYTVNDTYKKAIVEAMKAVDINTTLTAGSSDQEFYEAVDGLKNVDPIKGTAAIQVFANAFTKYALTQSPKLTVTATSGKIEEKKADHTFNSLAYGYYLVYQTGTEELQSSLVSVAAATGAEVNLKGQAPDITKTADKTSVEIGNIVTYTITGTIPDTTGYSNYQYIIHDTLSDGLDFVKNAQGDTQEGKEYSVSVQIDGESPAIQEATLSVPGSRTMELDLSEWIRTNSVAHAGKTFTVTYYAKVNADAVVTTQNDAYLEYGNDPDNTTNTETENAKTPTFPLLIHKYDKADDQNTKKTYLGNATFRIYRSAEDAKAGTKPIAVTGNNGSYTVALTQPTNNQYEGGEEQLTGFTFDMTSTNAAITGTIAGNFNLLLNGLAAGNYWIVETKAPDGYNGVTDPIKVTISASSTTDVDQWTINKNDTQETDKIIDIENTTGTILPGTGGMGTILFTVVGAALIIAVAGSFVVSRRRSL